MESPHSVFDQYAERFFEYAAAGDVEKVTACLKVISDIDLKNEKGWTALMFAARNGSKDVAQLLIDNGCDTLAINNSGQTALDIAQFWNHKAIIEILQPVPETDHEAGVSSLPVPQGRIKPNYFCTSILDRAAHRRKEETWLKQKLSDSKTKFMLFKDLQPVVVPLPDNTLNKTKPEQSRILTVSCDNIKGMLDNDPVIIFLGVESKVLNPAKGDPEEIAWFAVDSPDLTDDEMFKLHPHAQLMSLFPGITQITDKEAGILGQARSILAWHDRYRYCPTCGSITKLSEAGYKRQCTAEDCRSRQGVHNTSYPRVDPTVIMAVVSPDKRQLLLGQGKRFPGAMWSCLAGFMEPGESIEEACRREVKEESGVTVGHVEYHSCQPWPMPASLMIGCLGYATSTDITVDKEELQDARWFSRQDVVQMLTRQHPNGFFCPPHQAIAHQLIRTWVARTSNL